MQSERGTSKRPRLDPEVVKAGLIDISGHYAGVGGKQSGVRVLYRCPGCGKEDKFAANTSRGIVGCLNMNCDVPQVMGAIKTIAYFERWDTSRDFGRILAKGYEILGLPTTSPAREKKPGGAKAPPGTITPRVPVGRDADGAGGPGGPRQKDPHPAPDKHEDRTTDNRGRQAQTQPEERGPHTKRDLSSQETRQAGLPALREVDRTSSEEASRASETAHEGQDRDPETTGADGGPRTTSRARGGTRWQVGEGFDDGLSWENAWAAPQEDDHGAQAGVRHGRRVFEDSVVVDGEEVVEDEDIEIAEVVEERPIAAAEGTPSEDHAPASPSLLDAVYREILAACPLDDDHMEYLERRGVSVLTARRARLSSMKPAHAKRVKQNLLRRYGEDLLLSVPGFSKHPDNGYLRFTLSFECILIPYHDAAGNVTTIEGRYMGPQPPPKSLGKYVSLREGGNHLYVFPGFRPEGLEAVCEGVMGALVAAENEIAVGSIMGFRRYRSSPGSRTDGEDGGPLLEIVGSDFRGRRIPYIPDVDDPPQPEILAEAPATARHLVASQNGAPAIALLPSGKDLDEWLLSMRRSERRPAFTDLVGRCITLEEFQEDLGGTLGTPKARRRDIPTGRPATASADVTVTTRLDKPGGGAHARTDAAVQKQHAPRDRRELLDLVYKRILQEPTAQHLSFWDELGISRETVRGGAFGAVPKTALNEAIPELAERFGIEALLSVPGFGRTASGRVVFEVAGENNAVVPYKDGDGLITTLVAFPIPAEPGGDVPKPVFLNTQEDHLYVHPSFSCAAVVAVCEGPLQAILAAEAGVAVAAVAGPGRYRAQARIGTLPELHGVDFGGRKILYVPDPGSGERRSVQASYGAAEKLLERHGGHAAIVSEAFEKGFGGWLLSLPRGLRKANLSDLAEEARTLDELEAKVLTPKERSRRKAQRERGRASHKARDQHDGFEDPDEGTTKQEARRYPKRPAPSARKLPSAAFVTPGELVLSTAVALAVLWLVRRAGEVVPGLFDLVLASMPTWLDAPGEAAIAAGAFAGLSLWYARQSIRGRRRALHQGRIKH